MKNTLATPYSSRYGSTEDIPKYTLPKGGINANAAYQLIHDELDFDGKPNLNLASFVHTYMEPEAVPSDSLHIPWPSIPQVVRSFELAIYWSLGCWEYLSDDRKN